MDRLAMNELEAVRISDRIQGEPETAAADAYYFAKPLTHSVYYIQYNICREAEDLPMEDFAARAAKDLNAGAGRGAEALAADVSIPQTLEDTLNGKDTAVEWLLAHPEKLERKEFPDAPLTRGRFVGLLYEAAGNPAFTVEEPPFDDSLGIEWYGSALAWAKENGIAKGSADGTFSASRPITWRETAVFLSRAAEALGVPGPDPAAGPTPATSRQGPIPAVLAQGWEQDAVTWAWDIGLLPVGADFSKDIIRTQGETLAEAFGKLID